MDREVATDIQATIKKMRRGLAVMPFRDLDKTSNAEYLAVGIREDLISDLSSSGGFFVVAPAMTSELPETPEEIAEAAVRSGVRYAVTGNLRRIGGKVRINARLIDTATGENLWAERFDRAPEGLLSIFGAITSGITGALPADMTKNKPANRAKIYFPDPYAYDQVLRGNQRLASLVPTQVREANVFYRNALEHDPGYARAMGNLAFVHALYVSFGISNAPSEDITKALNLADRALAIDSGLAQAYLARGIANRVQRRFDPAIADIKKAIDLSPNNANAYAILSVTLSYGGQSKKGLKVVDDAILRFPDYPFIYHFDRGVALFHLERFEDAVSALRKALEKNSDHLPSRLTLASALGHLGRTEDAEWEFGEVVARARRVSQSWANN